MNRFYIPKFKYIIVVGLFINCLLAMTNIVATLAGVSKDVVECKTDDITTPYKSLYYGFDKIEPVDGLLEQFFIQGWVFAENDENVANEVNAMYSNKNKTIHAYLQNTTSGKIYRIKTERVSRLDIFRTFFSTINIDGMYHGFVCSFSTVKLPDGNYRFLLESKENDNISGITKTNLYFLKSGSKFRQETRPQFHIPSTILPDNAFKVGIDNVLIDNLNIKMSGWGFIEGVNIQEQLSEINTYIRVYNYDNEFLDFPLSYGYKRSDIADTFGKQYEKCGFTLDISDDFIELDQVSFQIVIEYNNAFYISNLFSNDRTEQSNNQLLSPIGDLESSNAINFAFDNLSIQGSMVQAIGWCANIIPQQEAMGEAYLQIKDSSDELRYYKLNLSHRQDITAALGEKQTVNGFNIQIPKDDFTGDRIEVRVIYLIDENHGVVSDKVTFLPLE